VVFDDVFVPWEHVFVYKNLEICNDQWWKTPAHAMGNHQSQIRLVTKLRLMMGLARRVAIMNGVDNIPEVQTLLGEMSSYAAMMEGLVDAQIATCTTNLNGYVEPGRSALYAAIVLQSKAYPRMLELLRELCGGGVIQLPSSVNDFTHPEMRDDIDRYIQSPNHRAEERVKLLKLVWDLMGSEFAGRQEQYEMFYAGPPFVVKKRMAMAYDFEKSDSLVEAILTSYHLGIS
jgi:4-hydroxyphenylacetate 3-monooxygenase